MFTKNEAFEIVKIDRDILNINVTKTVQNSFLNVDILREFPGLSKEFGEMSGIISIKLKPGAVPFSEKVYRIVPIELMDKLKKQLNRLESLKVLEKV